MTKEELAERNKLIALQYRVGARVADMARQYKISTARIYQILEMEGNPRPPPATTLAKLRVKQRLVRPNWSYPDETTLRLVHEIKQEMTLRPCPAFKGG